MFLIHRYFLVALIRISVIVTLVVTTLVLLTQSLRLMDILVKSEGAWGTFLALLGALIPTFLGVVLPLVLGGTILFFYYQKQRTQELIVLRAMGFSRWQLGLPAITLGLVVMMICFFLSLYGQPFGYRWLEDLKREVVERFASLLIREGTFTTIVKGVTIYVEEKTNWYDLSQIILHDQRTQHKDMTFIARKGYISHHGTSLRILLEDGVQQEYHKDTRWFSELYFQKYTLEFVLLDGDQHKRPIHIKAMPTATLWSSTATSEPQEHIRQVELHERFMKPFLVLCFTCIAVLTVFYGPYDRKSQSLRLLIGAGVMALLQSVSFGLIALARHHTEILVMSYTFHVGLLLLSLSLLFTDHFWVKKPDHDKQLSHSMCADKRV